MNDTAITTDTVMQEGSYRHDMALVEALADSMKAFSVFLGGQTELNASSYSEVIGRFIEEVIGVERDTTSWDLTEQALNGLACMALAIDPADERRHIALHALGSCTEVPVHMHIPLWDSMATELGLNGQADERIVIVEVMEVLDDEDLDPEFVRHVRFELSALV